MDDDKPNDKPEWFVPPQGVKPIPVVPSTGDNVIEISSARLDPIHAEANDVNFQAQAANKNAEELARRIAEDGLKLKEAAKEAGLDLKEVRSNPYFEARFKDLLTKYGMDAKARRAYVQSRAVEMAENSDEKGSTRLGALRILAADPEVGMTGQGPQVQVNVGDQLNQTLVNIDVDAE